MGALERWWHAPAPARRLAMLRLLVGGYAVAYLLVRFFHLISVTQMSAKQWKPVGPVVLLDAPLPPGTVVPMVVTTLVLGLAFVAGWRFRLTGPAFAAAFLWVTSYRNSWSMVFHTDNLMVLHVIVLATAPAADALSLDARRRGESPDDTPHAWYGWAIRLMCAVTVATYFIAGWSKLHNSGWGWVTSDTLRSYVAYDNLRKVELGAGYSWLGAGLAQHGWVFPPLAALSLAVELGAPLALLHARLGRVWAVGAWSFHVGVLVLMAIMFHYPVSGVAYTSFFPVERLHDRWQRWRTRR
ncbi:MAG: HTTM domain-containing protein [Myxococcales bacterium]|nr:HTTM domain-containing protein [Myxococcales bacterium]